jgi:hypothetical protein
VEKYTAAVLIGNSDDKLRQSDWSRYIVDVYEVVGDVADPVHFSGSSNPASMWQNFCWVFEVEEGKLPELREGLEAVRKRFGQESVALIVGETILV